MGNINRHLIRGGDVVTPQGTVRADIRVVDETIVELGSNLKPHSSERQIEATGLIVLPGGIDPHVHLTQAESGPLRRADDFASGSEAAVVGGITTLGNMTAAAPEERLHDAIARDTTLAERTSIVDVMLHPVLPVPSESVIAELPPLARAGYTSVKWFMSRRDFDSNVPLFLSALRVAKREGMLTLIHCEDSGILAASAQALINERKIALTYFAESRPTVAEVVAVDRAIGFCELTGAPIYIVHISSERALKACQNARSRKLPVYVEGRPTYLHLTEEKYRTVEGPLFIVQPPLRQSSDVDAMWRGVANGSIDTLGSDHAPWTREQKLSPELTITNHLAGVANLELMLPMLFSEGVMRGKLSLAQFASLSSTRAARIFGLYPQKGCLAPGSDADIALWDPHRRQTVRGTELASRAGYSVYEGTEVIGWPALVIRRGEVVLEEGRCVGEAGTGKVLRRDRVPQASRDR